MLQGPYALWVSKNGSCAPPASLHSVGLPTRRRRPLDTCLTTLTCTQDDLETLDDLETQDDLETLDDSHAGDLEEVVEGPIHKVGCVRERGRPFGLQQDKWPAWNRTSLQAWPCVSFVLV